MIPAPLPDDEAERHAALRRYDILDSPPEVEFDDFTWLASHICGTPIALITLLDGERQWFKSRVGLDATETPREQAFCGYAILGSDIFEVPNAQQDERFAENPLVTGKPDIRFYAGTPLTNPDGYRLGSLCVIDREPRQLSGEQRESLSRLGRQVAAQLELRLTKRRLEAQLASEQQAQLEISGLHAELKDHAAQIEDANRELTEFAYVVSHDLKAPLRGISSLATWLQKDYAHQIDESGRKLLSMMVGRVVRMDELINGILAYSRAGRTGSEEVEMDLATLVPNIIDMLAPAAHIQMEIVSPLPRVLMEPTKAQQLFQNLLGNAIKYLDKPVGRIRVGCTDGPDGFWQFSVADNGPGIDQKYFEKIFQLFQTLAPRDSVEGSGVGLALVRKFVEQLGGRIWVESELGIGSTFCFTLPKRPVDRSVP